MFDKVKDAAALKEELRRASKWLLMHPEASNLRVKIANMIADHGTDQEIEALIDETYEWLEKYPQSSNVRACYINLVTRHHTDRQLKECISSTASWISRNQQNPEILYMYLTMISHFQYKDEYPKAKSLAETWLATHNNSRNTNVLASFGALLYRMELYKQAIPYLKQALQINHTLFNSRMVYIWSLYYAGNKKEAIRELRAFQMNPEVYPIEIIYHQFGRLFYLEGDYLAAEKNFQLSIEKAPERYGGYWELGRTYIAMGNPRKALNYLISARARLPEDIHEEAKQEISDLIETALNKTRTNHP
jgi:tetratricopeptide (TPR) repeat protein